MADSYIDPHIKKEIDSLNSKINHGLKVGSTPKLTTRIFFGATEIEFDSTLKKR
jgi:hypothetical protein